MERPTSPRVLQPDTKQLLSALSAVNGKVPEVGLALLEGRMGPHGQRRFAWLLLELAELLVEHANREEFGAEASHHAGEGKTGSVSTRAMPPNAPP